MKQHIKPLTLGSLNLASNLCQALAMMLAVLVIPAMAVSQSKIAMNNAMQAQVPAIRQLAQQTDIVAAVSKANSQQSNFKTTKLVLLNSQWRQQLASKDKPLIDGVMKNALSQQLATMVKQSNGKYLGMMVMDNKALSIGQTFLTHDYWQRNRALWQKSFRLGKNGVYISGRNRIDHATNQRYHLIAVPVVNQSGTMIGAIAVKVNDAIALADNQKGSKAA